MEVKKKENYLRLGALDSDISSLLKYNENMFNHSSYDTEILVPLEDEQFAHSWSRYFEESKKSSVFDTLKQRLVQFKFPIKAGISEEEYYKDAVGSGIVEYNGEGLQLLKPKELALKIVSTAAGRIPVIITSCRDDFETLIRALAYHNEPVAIPKSMGAITISGYNNWDRINEYKNSWLKQNKKASESDWDEEFSRLIERPELYKDTFIILSDGPYSSVAAKELGIDEKEWKEYSLKIREGHEIAHYCTKRFFKSMRNNLLDEVICDYIGLINATGRFKAEWSLKFFGLEEFPNYRKGGRMQNYITEAKFSDSALLVLDKLLYNSVVNMERFDKTLLGKPNMYQLLFAITYFSLDELASKTAPQLLADKLDEVIVKWKDKN